MPRASYARFHLESERFSLHRDASNHWRDKMIKRGVVLYDWHNVGRRLLVFDDNEVVALLWAAVKREGGQSSFAKRHGVERGQLNRTLGGKLPVGRAVAKALGLRRVYTAE